MSRYRENEGFVTILINTHLKCNDVKFMDFFRFLQAQFAKLLYLIKIGITKKPTKFCPWPISASA